MLALWSVEIKDRNRLEMLKKRRPQPLATSQVELFYCQPLGQEKGKS